MTPRRVLEVRYEVTDFTDEELASLTLEATSLALEVETDVITYDEEESSC